MNTNSHVPSSIREEKTLAETRIILSRRNIGNTKAGGIVLIVMGLFITVFMVFWMAMPLKEAFKQDDPMDWFLLIFGLMGLPGLVVGLGLTLLGFVVLFNISYSEIH